ncbi:hypothetical protein Tco_0325880, partial [Tanacetum coccineum]
RTGKEFEDELEEDERWSEERGDAYLDANLRAVIVIGAIGNSDDDDGCVVTLLLQREMVATYGFCDGGPSEESRALEESMHKNGEIAGSREMCSGEA